MNSLNVAASEQTTTPPLEPTPLSRVAQQRIQSLDVIRGFALLGILVMNIQSFSMPIAAYTNPTAFGDLTGINAWVWTLGHLFIDAKFMSLFSMLFGVGIILFCENLERKGIHNIALHRRRMLWLLVFGLLHAYLIWDGDILFTYAVCGFIVSAFRHHSVKSLWTIGICLLGIGWLLATSLQWILPFMATDDIQMLNDDWAPSAQMISEQINIMTGSWLPRFSLRAENSLSMQTVVFLFYSVWRVAGLMLIGMALHKQGVFEGRIHNSTLGRSAVILLAFGLLIVGYGAFYNHSHEWRLEFSLSLGTNFNYIGSVLMAIGYLYLWVIIVKCGWLIGLTQRLAYVGRMAFTNYISQSLICTLLFYGSGLGLFGQVARWQQLLIVVAIWALQITWSQWYLRRFNYGPLEWAWRRLTYR